MTVNDVYTRLLSAGWKVLHESAELRTLFEPGSNQLMTLAGSGAARVPDVTLNDIRWTAGAL